MFFTLTAQHVWKLSVGQNSIAVRDVHTHELFLDSTGVVSVFYTSAGEWAPTHGVFDRAGQLWVLECSDKNEIRAVRARPSKNATVPDTGAIKKQPVIPMAAYLAVGTAALILAFIASSKGKRKTAK